MEEQTELINVIFDPNFQSFDSELSSLSLDKMMSIQYSEELLQKNFAILISILKQLHKGMVLMNSKVSDNSEWVQKLREVSETPEAKQQNKETIETMETKLNTLEQLAGKEFIERPEFEQAMQKYNKITQLQQLALSDLEHTDEQQGKQLESLENNVTQQQEQIGALNTEIENIKNQLSMMKTELHEVEERKPEQVIVENIIVKEVAPVAAPMAVPLQYQDESINQINKLIKDLQNTQAQQQQDINQLKNNLNQGTSDIQPVVDLSEIEKKLQGHEDEIQTLFESLDQLRQKIKDQNGNGQEASSDEINSLKNDLRKLQLQIDALQTQLNLATIGEGQSMEENQVAMILGEINKLRAQLPEYCTNSEFQNDCQKKDSKLKSVTDRIDEEIDKVRREFKGKMEKKIEQPEISRLEKEILQMREHMLKKRGSQHHVETPTRQPTVDKELLNQIKELQHFLKEIESDLLNHKTQMNQTNQQLHIKLTEIEKKMQSIQTDKIYIELQNLREMMDSVKREQDQNKSKISNFAKKIESIVTREELFQTFDPKLKQVKDEVARIGDEVKFSIERKAEVSDVKQLNQTFIDQLQNVVTELIKTLANKQETKKALIYLEQKVQYHLQQINQIFMILEGDGAKEQDSLFVKKPLNWSCASCDKDLEKYKGQLGDFKNWAVFPPKETSPERMGRFGVGYKNMQEKQKSQREKLDKDRNNTLSSHGNQNAEVANAKQNSTMTQQQQSLSLSQSQTQLPKIKQ